VSCAFFRAPLQLASQVAAGEEKCTKLEFTEKKEEWLQHDPANTLIVKWLNEPTQILRAGTNYGYLSSFTTHNCRTPGGHQKVIEAFANIYRNFCTNINCNLEEYNLPRNVRFPKWKMEFVEWHL
jgi:hypothetical protein